MELISAALTGYQLCAWPLQGTGPTVIKNTQSFSLGSSYPSGPYSDWFKFTVVLIFLLYLIIFYI